MILISRVDAVLKPDEQVKADAASKQMRELLEHVGKWVKYRLLTPRDRQDLVKSGYARDLVDNLVYCTQRSPVPGEDKAYDHHVIGFTDLAFDPSIYACESISRTLQKENNGRCAWCESLIEQNDGIVSHYRPTYGYYDKGILHRDGYYDLAYKQDNLLYTCRHCAEHYKTDMFPFFQGGRASGIALEDEKPILINPYTEEPRRYIRFNPVNGHAYAYDKVQQFYQDTRKISQAEIDTLVWTDPANIPNQLDINEASISTPAVNAEFAQWQSQQVADNSCARIRGEKTIDILGLNRTELVRSRIAHLRHIRGIYMAQGNSNDSYADEVSTASELLTALGTLPGDNNVLAPQYISLTVDALNTWNAAMPDTAEQQQDNSDKQDDTPVESTAANKSRSWLELYNAALKSYSQNDQTCIPAYLRSGLMYIVLKSEQALRNKRRIVSLSANDLLYASVTSECVLLQIDWDADFNNIIKVHSNNHTWETSFKELAETHPVALMRLFETNEIWAEGNYEALSDV